MRKLMLAVAAVASLTTSLKANADDFEAWMQSEEATAVTRLNLNISAPGTKRGVILASPSTKDPNYYYFWVRDGAMVMRAIFDRLAQGEPLADIQFKDYVAITRQMQWFAQGNLGEPRFNVVDATVNTEPWGRPQNDGPALRAITLIRYANKLLAEGDRPAVERDLYAAELPAHSVIKQDLEFVAHHWQDLSVDLWEEVQGHHFFTEAAQLVAMQQGAELATTMGDDQAAAFYLKQAGDIEAALAKHWDSNKGYYLSALDFRAGANHQKPSQLDVSVLLAALFLEQPQGMLSLMDDHIIKTANALEDTFARIYPINSAKGDLGTSIGRYSEDHYYGGNPWVLSTAAYAEWNYRMALILKKQPTMALTITQANYLAKVMGRTVVNLKLTPRTTSAAIDALKARGDSYLQRVRISAGVTGELAEQFDLATGVMMSARDLSWSYASFLRAANARAELSN